MNLFCLQKQTSMKVGFPIVSVFKCIPLRQINCPMLFAHKTQFPELLSELIRYTKT